MYMTRPFMKGDFRKSSGGFTLIELMIVVAILGVIVAIAIPNYRQHQFKSRRSDAERMLTDLAARQEQYFLDNKSYTTTLSNLGYTQKTVDGVTGYYSENDYYRVAATVSGATYTLTATPRGAQSSDACGDLSILETGARFHTGTTGASCWGVLGS